MLSKITWTDYILAVGTLVILYYLYVGIRYFQADIREIISGQRKLNFRPNPVEISSVSFPEDDVEHATAEFEEAEEDEFSEVESLIGQIKMLIEGKPATGLTSKEFKQDLHLILIRYPSVKDSPFRSSINELIVSECEKNSAVTMSESDVDLLWEEAM